ncbi:hypothetical protein CMK19_09130 [Candidatus Poribacteria bacterium]|nr:hypothetical protein [Candidatus Poribacteria bacterium]
MNQKAIWVYPWDLVDTNIDGVVSHLAEEIGINTISLATAYHSVEHLRPRAVREKIFRSANASLYFQPTVDFCQRSPLSPNIHPMVQDNCILDKFIDSCQRKGIAPKSWTVYLHNSFLSSNHPDCAQQNVYGDYYSYGLCPANPQVRSYVINLSKELENRGIDIIEIESLSYMGFGHNHYHSKFGVDFGTAKSLMDLCFCYSCQQHGVEANIDIRLLTEQVKSDLNVVLSQGKTNLSWQDYLHRIPDLANYMQMQEQIVESLLGEIKQATSCELDFIMMGGGLNTDSIADICDKVEILTYTADPKQVKKTIESTVQRIGSADQILTGYSVYGSATPDVDTLKQTVGTAVEAGVRNVSFYNYGIMPPTHLDWVRQAIQKMDEIIG